MKCFDGIDSLEITREKGVLTVSLDSGQFVRDDVELVSAELDFVTDADSGDSGATISYQVPEIAVSLTAAIQNSANRVERLRLAQRLVDLLPKQGAYRIPFLHPENIVVVGDRLSVIHYGLRGLVAPMRLDDAHVLRAYQALVLTVFDGKARFEKLLAGGSALEDRFSRRVLACESVGDLSDLVDRELVLGQRELRDSKFVVSRGRYRILWAVSICLAVLAVVAGCFAFFYHAESTQKDAIISAEGFYAVGDYTNTQQALDKYPVDGLSSSVRYVLAVSSVNTSGLDQDQKQTVLSGLSPKSDDNTLNYWVYLGRGDFDKSLDLAQNIGDDQLTLLAYTDLYESTRINTTMDGAKKQQLLQDYQKKIDDLTKKLGQ